MFIIIIQAFFYFIDIGQLGRFSDGGTFANASFGQAFEAEKMSLLDPRPLPETSGPSLPCVMVGDEAFPLKEYLLRPLHWTKSPW